MLEEYLKKKVLTEEDLESSRRINKKYNDWMNFFNIYLPFNIIMKYQGLYLKITTEYSDHELKNVSKIKNTNNNYKLITFYLNLFLLLFVFSQKNLKTKLNSMLA